MLVYTFKSLGHRAGTPQVSAAGLRGVSGESGSHQGAQVTGRHWLVLWARQMPSGFESPVGPPGPFPHRLPAELREDDVTADAACLPARRGGSSRALSSNSVSAQWCPNQRLRRRPEACSQCRFLGSALALSRRC